MAKKNVEKKQEKVVKETTISTDDVNSLTGEENAEAINEPELPEEQPKQMDAALVNEALIKLEEEKEDYKNALIRERADFENYKKRNADLSACSYKNGMADTVLEILPVLDNFERALAAECVDKAFVEGMQMIMKQLLGVLKEFGVEKIDTEGQFDPEFHNAVMQVEEDGFDSNDIVETMQNGYKLKDRILRHAMVKVNK